MATIVSQLNKQKLIDQIDDKLAAHRRRPTVIDAEVTLLGPGADDVKKWHLNLPHLGLINGME